MTRREICATCSHFTFDGGRPAEGIGRCTIYNDSSHEPLVRWDHAPTILYGRAKDMPKRLQFIAERERKESGNAVAA